MIDSCVYLWSYLSSLTKSLVIRSEVIETMSGAQHPAICDNGGATADPLIRTLGLFISVDFSQKFESPAVKVCLSEVCVRPASSGLYFLNQMM